MKAIAPGKLILSGEHAVVYGKPAIALAIDRFTHTTISRNNIRGVGFNFIDLNLKVFTTIRRLVRLMHRLTEKHKEFIHHRCQVSEILQKPYELAQFVSILVLKQFNVILDRGIDISVQSSIPIGCGMGSSAATTVSMIHAIAHYFHLPINPKFFLKLALEAERLQHGYSSGLDLHVSYYGGCIYFQQGNVLKRTLPDIPMFLVQTGTPLTSTGQCVSHAANTFKTSDIADDFAAVTEAIDDALRNGSMKSMQYGIRANQHLLETIGVVPAKVSEFIRAIEQLGGAAKICGAGAVAGNNAGSVLLVIDQPPIELLEQYGYSFTPIKKDVPGAHIITSTP